MTTILICEPVSSWLDRRLPRGLSRIKPDPNSLEAFMSDLSDINARFQAVLARAPAVIAAATAAGVTEGLSQAATAAQADTGALAATASQFEAAFPASVAQADPAAVDPAASPQADPVVQ